MIYYSKTLSPPESNYWDIKQELIMVKAIKHFTPYLYEQKFQLRTVHA